MFKIKHKEANVWIACTEERIDRFIAIDAHSSLPSRYTGMEVREEFLKTHWQRAEEWQDVTGGLEVSNDGQLLRQPSVSTLKTATAYVTDKNYRFVKMQGYLINRELLDSLGLASCLIRQVKQTKATLLRVERKTE